MPPYHLGLSMAGAISAGAYSAGVFDFLTEALDQWQNARDAKDPTVPGHDVIVSVFSGASAGAITAALGLVALADKSPAAAPQPMPLPKGDGHTTADGGQVLSGLPRLYHAWVTGPRFLADDGGNALLGTADLGRASGTAPIGALLDVSVLDDIVTRAFTGLQPDHPQRPWLTQTVHLFVTHSSLRGVPYDIHFAGGSPGTPGYPMVNHADRVHYALSGLGAATTPPGPWAGSDPARTLEVPSLKALQGASGPWAGYATAALASSAFPIGLQARLVAGVTPTDYLKRAWPVRTRTGTPVSFTPRDLPDPPEYVAVDGGVIDNEPFQLARWSLMAAPPASNDPDPLNNDRAVIMVDPFPEAEAPENGPLDSSLMAVLGGLFPMLKDQARFKLDEMVDALDESIASRYLIGPVRYTDRGAHLPPEQRYQREPHAIACGLLGGFGGFLAESFRAHDYQLGRYNCFRFLKEHFALPPDNIILKDGYAGVDSTPWTTSDGTALQIIPLIGTAASQSPPPVWPRVFPATVTAFTDQAMVRANALLRRMMQDLDPGWAIRGYLAIGWIAGKKRVRDTILWTVKQDLIRRDQLVWAGADLGADDRLVLTALASPSTPLRSLDGLERETHLSPTRLRDLLQTSLRDLVRRNPTSNRKEHWCLTDRIPGRAAQNISRLLGIPLQPD